MTCDRDMNHQIEEISPTNGKMDEISIDCRDDSPMKYNSKGFKAPFPGMEFDSERQLFEYYINYGSQEGFSVIKKSGRSYEDSQFVVLACGRCGKPKCKEEKLPNQTAKIGCQAKINVKVYGDGKARVNSVVLEHNHELSPNKVRYFKRNRVVSEHVKRQLALNNQVRVDVAKDDNAFLVESRDPEYLPVSVNDCQNFVEEDRKLCHGVDYDAEVVIKYFSHMQRNSSNFHYSIDYDDEGHIRNIFWVDARSRAAYNSFGDVVSFDTTYLTNRYGMPFASFSGVNHHGQSILFGCGLISIEDEHTFVWLFQEWLSCMSGKAPDAIITNQDKTIQNAVEIVFPTTRHRWCLWHILKKIPEKLSSCFNYELVKSDLMNIAYDSMSRDEFESRWQLMTKAYNLVNDTWLVTLYTNRHRWVPAFVKDKFWAGMSTTQRSESIHTFLDGYVNSKTMLKQFVEQCENALRTQAEKESQQDFVSFNATHPCITRFYIEKQFQEVYTNAKFKEVQDEFKELMYCHAILIRREGTIGFYNVSEDMVSCNGPNSKRFIYNVYFNKEEFDVKCTCCLFEFRGVLCRHALAVLTLEQLQSVPTKYILARWRKDLKREHTRVKVSYLERSKTPEMYRFDRICNLMYEVAEKGSSSEEQTQMVEDCIREILAKMDRHERVIDSCEHMEQAKVSSIREQQSSVITENNSSAFNCSNACLVICSPITVRSTEQLPSKRKKFEVDQVIKEVRKNEKNKRDQSNEAEKLAQVPSGNSSQNDHVHRNTNS